MSKIRVYELAKMLGKTNKELMALLGDLGVEAKSHMSSIDSETAQIVEDAVSEKPGSAPAENTHTEGKPAKEPLNVQRGDTVAEVAGALGVKPADAVKKLIAAGQMIPAGAPVNREILDILSIQYDREIAMDEQVPSRTEPAVRKKPKPKGDNLSERAPIVTVMGHVDHGKTTVLDYIRNTNITGKEAGGITQHIGASAVRRGDRQIVFLDTPGHEAFTAMRARGAQATDIVVLVVAAEDGVMPQTVEALNHAKAAGVPIVVAINKVDKPEARPDRVRQQLSDNGLVPEEWGGDTVMVEVSAKTGLGIEHLLEMILLVADMTELRADSSVDPEGIVVEAQLDKGKGPVATVIVQQGTLRKGDILLTESACGRIRAMLDDRGKNVDTAGPSTAVEILGLNTVPQPGDMFRTVSTEKEARRVLDEKEAARREAEASPSRKITLEELYSKMQEGETPTLGIVLKCDVQGSIEALKGSLQKLETEEVRINFVHEGVGRISESDVMLASASEAVIIGFNVRPDKMAKKISEDEGVQIRLYRVIYDVIEDVKAALEGMLTPEIREQSIGQAEIRAVFKIPKSGKAAGCYVTEGSVRRNAKVRIVRDGVVIWEGSLTTLKRFKDDAREVAAGYECGMSFANYQDFREGDLVEVFELVEEKRTLD